VTLTLITGPANSAKAGEVLGAYAAAAPRGALLVVPTAEDVRHYERELVSHPERPAVLGSVLTFEGLIRVIAERVGYGGRVLTRLQRGRVLAGVLGRLEFDALGASARGAGFVGAAGDLIAELERSLVTPARFTQALRAWAAQDVRRAPFSHDLGRIYGGYARELERLRRDDHELFARRALDALRAEPAAWTRRSRDAVFVYGFDDLTALERDALETLARLPGAAVTVSLTYEPGRTALIARAEAVEALRPLADEVRELPASDTYYAPATRAVLHRLERHLFEAAPPDGPEDPEGRAVTLLEAGGERAEAELVAGEVLALARAGMPLEEIVVVHRAAGRAAGGFAGVFAAYGIPLATRREVAFAHTPLGRGVLGAARCAWLADDAAPADLLAYLRTPGLLREPEVADDLEAEVRRTGVTSVAAARAALGWELRELDSLAAAVAPSPARPGVPGDPTAELCRLARRLLAAPHRERAAQLDADEELDARALAVLTRALAELGELAELVPSMRPAPAELLELLAGLPVPLGASGHPAPGSGVRLAEPAEIRARRYRAVFVCGLQEGEFPSGGRPEPFLSDERRRELALASGLRLRPREDAAAAERYLFYAAVSRATERVFLAYRSSDEEGNLALPSPFISDVAALLGPRWRTARHRRPLADVTWPADRAPTEREAARARAAARAPLSGDAPEPARRLGPAALGHVRHTRIVSAGALERYSDCPVRWLVESEIAPATLEPEADALTRGSLIHGVLEALIAALGAPVTAANLDRAEAVLAEQVAALEADGVTLGAGRPGIVRAGALAAIEADLRRYLRHEAALGTGWQPRELEWRFGFEDEDPGSQPVRGGGLPALVLGAGENEVRVRGVIDRVDVGPDDRAIVRDYKSGAPGANWPVARWHLERRLQVALYLLVVRDLAGLDPVAGVYQPLRGEDLRARGAVRDGAGLGPEVHERDVRTAEEFSDELADAAARALTLAGRLRAGEITPCPQTCSPDGCAHPAICRSR
jgi:ATP-dependent helicase/DNAse subunit B